MECQLKVNTKIRDKTAGDDWTIRRNVVNVPASQSIVKAWMTVKKNLEDADADAIIQKVVDSPIDTPGTGQIENDGASTHIAIIRFDLTNEETALLEPYTTYFYDIQVQTSTDKYDTPDDGTIIAKPQITQST